MTLRSMNLAGCLLFAVVACALVACQPQGAAGRADVFARHVGILNSALDRYDTLAAMRALDSVAAHSAGTRSRREVAAYEVMLDPDARVDDLRDMLLSLDSVAAYELVDGQIRMRIKERYAAALFAAGRADEAVDMLSKAAALAYQIDDKGAYVRLRIEALRRAERSGRYAEAINGYLRLLDYVRKAAMRDAEAGVLFRMVLTFRSMGEISTARIYLDKMSSSPDSASVERCLYLFASAFVEASESDTAAFRRSLVEMSGVMRRNELIRNRFEPVYDAFRAFSFLAEGSVDTALALIAKLRRTWHEGGYMPSGVFLDVMEADAMLKSGKRARARAILDGIDAGDLRQNNVAIFSYYADVMTGFYALLGNERSAYAMQRQKTSLLDSLKAASAVNNFIYKYIGQRREAEIDAQRRLLDKMSHRDRQLEIVRSWWVFVAFLLAAILLGAYIAAVVRRRRGSADEWKDVRATLEEEVDRQKAMLQEQKEQLKEQNDAIRSELMFANHVQSNILPGEDMLDVRGIDDHFIVFAPYDLVSGDFYWVFDSGDKLFVCVGDATGHGMHGAMIAMMAVTLLGGIVVNPAMREPSRLVEKLSDEMGTVLRNIANRDGVDLSLFCLDRVNGKASICLARHTVYVVRASGESYVVQGVKRSVGETPPDGKDRPFVAVDLELSRGDCVYMTTDGFPDQFGGLRNQKFMRRRFRQMIQELYTHRMFVQSDAIRRRFDDWKGDNPQTDDVLVVGLRMGDMKSSRFERFNAMSYFNVRKDGVGEEPPAEVRRQVQGLIDGLVAKFAECGRELRLDGLVPIFGDCFLESVDGVVRVTPSDSAAPRFVVAEVQTGEAFAHFGVAVESVVLCLPAWFNVGDATKAYTAAAVSTEVERDIVRLTISSK